MDDPEESPFERTERITLEMVERLTKSDVLDSVLAEDVVYFMEPVALLHTSMLVSVPGLSPEQVNAQSEGFGQHLAIFARVCFELGREHQRILHLFAPKDPLDK
jgi:hypothetical protein